MWGCYYLIDFIDHIAGEGKQGRYKLTKEDGTTENVILKLDDGAEVEGTPINRENMMAIQDFIGMTTEKTIDGGVLQTNADGHTLLTVKNADGSITQTFTGEKVITKTITRQNGKIVEVVS